MTSGNDETAQLSLPKGRGSRSRRLTVLGVLGIGAYLLAAYVVLPMIWRRATHDLQNLAGAPIVAHTMNGIPGDPVNIALVGSKSEVIQAMTKAGWFPPPPSRPPSASRWTP